MIISRLVDWLMEKGLLRPSHRWRRQKLLHSLEETHISHPPEHQSLAKNSSKDRDPSQAKSSCPTEN